jgi:uncharacterized membrane protein YgaE (UPF0421/DUF939 family)
MYKNQSFKRQLLRCNILKQRQNALAEQVISNLNKAVSLRALNTDGGQKTAQLIHQLLNSKTPQ